MHRILLLLLSGAIACTPIDKKTKTDAAIAITDSTALPIDQEVVIFNSDTLVVDRKAAVFYQPDSAQMEKRAKKVGEGDFRAGADDYMYGMHLSYEFAESKKLSILDVMGPKILKFVGADKSYSLVKLDTLPELWGVYFFEPTQKPKEVDMMAIEDEYKAYFK